MSTALLQQDLKQGPTKPQKALMVVACVLPVIFAVVAMPALMSTDEEPVLMPGGIQPAATNTDPADLVATEDLVDEPEVDPNAIETAMDGDLAIAIHLDVPQLKAGQPLTAEIEYTNHSMDDLHLPAAGEPSGTRAVVVLDSEGMEVRRIVEKGQDPLLARTMLVATGTRASVPVTILAHGEEALAAGKYSAHVEFSADPLWRRLGVRTWTAPKGTIRSFPVFFDVAE